MVDGNGLENRRASNGTVGSNPTPSAKYLILSSDNLLNGVELKEQIFAAHQNLKPKQIAFVGDVQGEVPKWLKGTVC